jgi:Domain of unknown function (DUF5011)
LIVWLTGRKCINLSLIAKKICKKDFLMYFCTAFVRQQTKPNNKTKMKKQLIAIASVAMIAGVFTLTSCSKEDTTAPTITITGGNTVAHVLNAPFTAPTATATDDEDGDLTTSITMSGTVNENLASTNVYVLEYTVSDAAGNTATETVNVTVSNSAAAFNGSYNVLDTIPAVPLYFNYPQTVTPSTTVNGRVHFNKFADYVNNTTIYATISGTIVSLPAQTTGQIGTNNHIHDFIGTGSTSGTTIIINYTDNDQTASASAAGVMHLIHQ